MLRQVTVGAAALLFAGSASAAELIAGDELRPVFDGTTAVAPVSFTQNDTDAGLIGTVACGVTASHTTDNSFLRRFFLTADHGISDALTVLGVEIGISQIDFISGALGIDVPFTVNVHSIAAADALVFANLTLLDTADNTASSDDLDTLVETAVGGLVDPATDDLVVEIFTPSGEFGVDGSGADPYQFRPGSSTSATSDAYLAAADCGITEPIEVTGIGFPDNQFFIRVNGDEDDGTVPTENATWSAVKSLF